MGFIVVSSEKAEESFLPFVRKGRKQMQFTLSLDLENHIIIFTLSFPVYQSVTGYSVSYGKFQLKKDLGKKANIITFNKVQGWGKGLVI